VQPLADLDPRIVPGRAREALQTLGLSWAATIELGGDRKGLVFGGRQDEGGDLADWERRLLLSLLGSATVALRNLIRIDELAELSAGSLRGLVAAVELGNPWERGHAERVARSAVRLGRAIGLSEQQLRDLSLSAMLHDVGKVGAGSDPEGSAKMHPVVGSTILSRGHHSADVIHGVEQHHERFDGEGFPFGLSGEAIHPFGRILAIADAYDRMTRASETPLSSAEALARLERGAGLLWDPGLVTVFIEEIGRSPADSGPPSGVWLRQIVARDPAV
jgi:HD-GYP domain-containing protein (c-di-GMP phosphodiesterase class II)